MISSATEVSEDQTRIRQNMPTTDKTSDLYKRYMTKVGDQETRLETLNDELGKARIAHDQLAKNFRNFLGTLNVE